VHAKETSLQRRSVTQHGDDAGEEAIEEAIENEELSPARKITSRVGRGSETMLERLFEPFRRHRADVLLSVRGLSARRRRQMSGRHIMTGASPW
jgi:hypothetical protein